MEVGLILAHRYPSEPEPPVNYEVLNNEISRWSEAVLGPKPTTDQLRSWWLGAEKWAKKRQLRDAADKEYRSILAPEGIYTEVEKDEILEKKAAIRAGVSVPLNVAQQRASDTIDLLRQKRIDRFREANQLEQGANETLEQAVERVRQISW